MIVETPTKFRLRFRKGDVFSLATRNRGLRPVFFHRYSSHGFICFDSFGTLYKCYTIGHWGEFETTQGHRVHTMPAYRTQEAYDKNNVNFADLRMDALTLVQNCRDRDKLEAVLALFQQKEA